MSTVKRKRGTPAFAASCGLPSSSSLRQNRCASSRSFPVACAPAAAPATTIPASPNAAYTQARAAIGRALDAGSSRIFVEVDVSGGDETYTLLKNSVPVAIGIVPGLQRAEDGRQVSVLLPDSGAAALMTRDWASGAGAVPDGIEVSGLDGARVDPSVDEAVAVVVPRASDVDRMEAIVADAGGIPVLIVNPDLVDMGVTGLSLNARQLRERFIDAFETAYYLKVFPWGVVLRAYPGRWALWRNDTEAEGGYSLVAELDRRPSAGDIEKALGDGAGEGDGQGALQGFFSGLSRFLKLYSKG